MRKQLFLLLTALVAVSLQTLATVQIRTYSDSETLTSSTNSDIKGGTITWDKSTRTITFDNVSIDITRSSEDFEIMGDGNVTLKLIGDNTIKSQQYVAFYDMLVGVLTITSDDGKGTLTCEGDHGIYVSFEGGELLIKNCKVTATGKTNGGIHGDGWNYESFKRLTVDNADLTAKGKAGGRKYGSISWVDDLVTKDCYLFSPAGVYFAILPLEVDGSPYNVGGLTTDGVAFTTEEVVIKRIAIDEETFTDPVFRQYVKDKIDTDHNGYLSDAEMEAVTEIDVRSKGIEQLTNLSLFWNLKKLDASSNNLGAKGIFISSNANLEDLDLYNCGLTSINLHGLSNLRHLNLGYNKLSALDVSQNTKLTWLDFYYNTDITSADFSMLTELEYLNVYGVPLGTLDVSKNTKLTNLQCPKCNLTTLDVSMLPNLKTLVCGQNKFVSLDLSHNLELEEFRCNSGYVLETLNISACTKLKKLEVCYNKLSELVVPASPDLYSLEIYNNKISGAEMKAFVESLPTVSTGYLRAVNSYSSTEGNVMTTLQVAAAKAKGWKVYHNNSHPSNWVEYEGSSPGIAIDATNFPDDKFRAEIAKKRYDDDQDGFLSDEEIASTALLQVNELDIENLTGVEHFKALKYLHCNYNKLTSIDVSALSNLEILNCVENQLTSLDVTHNLALKDLACRKNKLTALDVTKNTALELLYCQDNQLTALNVENNPKLRNLYCSGNKLAELDVTKNWELQALECFANELAVLDLTNNGKLTTLDCSLNKLAALDLSKFAYDMMPNVYIFSNQINETAMQALVESLPTVTDGGLYVIDSSYPGEKNVINTTQVALALTKGWTVMDYCSDGMEKPYEGTTPSAIDTVRGSQPVVHGYYTLDGRKVQGEPKQKGVYIINGSKVVVK